jgi:hypothetical protein
VEGNRDYEIPRRSGSLISSRDTWHEIPGSRGSSISGFSHTTESQQEETAISRNATVPQSRHSRGGQVSEGQPCREMTTGGIGIS